MNEDFEKFANEVKDRIFENSGDRDNLDIELRHVQKVNQQDLLGLTVKPKESNIAPTVYLNSAFEAYQEGQSMENILHSLENTITEHSIMNKIDVDCFSKFDGVKDQIFPKLINKDMNNELLEKVPHYDFGDLAVLFYVKIDSPQISGGSVTVNNQIIERWGVDDKTLMDSAMKNLKDNTQCKDLFGFIQEIAPGMNEAFEADVPVDKSPIIISTDSQMFGAAAILNEDIMKGLCDRVGGDIIIIPSSIHECLIMGDENTPDQERALNHMVHEVNSTTVAQEDLLSEHIYHFNGEEFMYKEIPLNASIETIKNTPFTNLDLVSAQTGDIYRMGKEEKNAEQEKGLTADKSQEKNAVVNIGDKKQGHKKDELAM